MGIRSIGSNSSKYNSLNELQSRRIIHGILSIEEKNP
jgi:hypothetical protein